jgi:hypothetical protein
MAQPLEAAQQRRPDAPLQLIGRRSEPAEASERVLDAGRDPRLGVGERAVQIEQKRACPWLPFAAGRLCASPRAHVTFTPTNS